MNISSMNLPPCFYLQEDDLSVADKEQRMHEARTPQSPKQHLYEKKQNFLVYIVSCIIALTLLAINHFFHLKGSIFLQGVLIFLSIAVIATWIISKIRLFRSPFRRYCGVTHSFFYQTYGHSITVYPLIYLYDVTITHHYFRGTYIGSLLELFINETKRKLFLQTARPEHATIFANLLLRVQKQLSLYGPQTNDPEEQWIWQALEHAKRKKAQPYFLKSAILGIFVAIASIPAIYLGFYTQDQIKQKNMFNSCKQQLQNLQKNENGSTYYCYDYLQIFPKGHHAVEVENLLFSSLQQTKDLKDEETKLIDQKNRIEAYINFQSSTPYLKKGKELLDQLETRIFSQAQQTKNLSFYETAFPKGQYIHQLLQIKQKLFTEVIQEFQEQLLQDERTKTPHLEGRKLLLDLFTFLEKNQTLVLPFVLEEEAVFLQKLPSSIVPVDPDFLVRAIQNQLESSTAHALQKLLPYSILTPQKLYHLDENSVGIIFTYTVDYGEQIFTRETQASEVITKDMIDDLKSNIDVHANGNRRFIKQYQELKLHFKVQIQVPGHSPKIFQFSLEPNSNILVKFNQYNIHKMDDDTYKNMLESALQKLTPMLLQKLGIRPLPTDETLFIPRYEMD